MWLFLQVGGEPSSDRMSVGFIGAGQLAHALVKGFMAAGDASSLLYNIRPVENMRLLMLELRHTELHNYIHDYPFPANAFISAMVLVIFMHEFSPACILFYVFTLESTFLFPASLDCLVCRPYVLFYLMGSARFCLTVVI